MATTDLRELAICLFAVSGNDVMGEDVSWMITDAQFARCRSAFGRLSEQAQRRWMGIAAHWRERFAAACPGFCGGPRHEGPQDFVTALGEGATCVPPAIHAADEWKPGAQVRPPASGDYPWPHHSRCQFVASGGQGWCDCHELPSAPGGMTDGERERLMEEGRTTARRGEPCGTCGMVIDAEEYAARTGWDVVRQQREVRAVLERSGIHPPASHILADCIDWVYRPALEEYEDRQNGAVASPPVQVEGGGLRRYAEEGRPRGVCYDCRRPYGSWPDLLVPDAVWAIISPSGHEGGLLCPTCIAIRCEAAGLENVPAAFASGALRSVPYRDREEGELGMDFLADAHLRKDGPEMRALLDALRPFAREGRDWYGPGGDPPDTPLTLVTEDGGTPVAITVGDLVRAFVAVCQADSQPLPTMPSHGQLRGHRTEWRGDHWVYADTGEPTATVPYVPRPCGICGEPPSPEDHDACIRDLPGAMNACCGHGVAREAYIQYPDGSRVGGDEAIEVMRSMGAGPPIGANDE